MSAKYASNSEFVQSLAKDIEDFMKYGGGQPNGDDEKKFTSCP